MVMPKPDLVELTGGYRRVPVLQIGADIYCDTHCIARALDRLHPDPPLSPRGQETRRARALALGRDHLHDGRPRVLRARRRVLRGVRRGPQEDDGAAGPEPRLARKWCCRRSSPAPRQPRRLERQLADGRAFLLGVEPSLADLSAFHPLLMLRRAPAHSPRCSRRCSASPPGPTRVRAIGHGKPTPLSSAEAIAIARAARARRLRGRAGAARGHAARRPRGDPRRRVRLGERRRHARRLRPRTRSPCADRPSARARWWCTSRARTTAWSRPAKGSGPRPRAYSSSFG